MSNIQEEIAKERELARVADNSSGKNSGESTATGDAVEELETEALHQPKLKSSFEQYCDDHPDASECRIYED